MVGVIVAILIASWIVGQGDGNGNADVDAFPASRAWLYVAIVAVGYMVSRGLAKAGSRDPYWSTGDDPCQAHGIQIRRLAATASQVSVRGGRKVSPSSATRPPSRRNPTVLRMLAIGIAVAFVVFALTGGHVFFLPLLFIPLGLFSIGHRENRRRRGWW